VFVSTKVIAFLAAGLTALLLIGLVLADWAALRLRGPSDTAERAPGQGQVTRSTITARAGADTARDGDIVLGMSAAFTGPSRDLGTELYRGAAAYFEHVNRAGGVGGRNIRIKAYDDGYNPGPAIENTERLVERDNVFLLFGYVGTPTVTRVLPLLKKYEDRSVYLFFPFTGAGPHRQPPYDEKVFNLRASYHQETAGLVENFLKIGRKRLAVFYQIDAYGRSGWDGVRQALGKHGLKIASEATYRRGTAFSESLRPQVDILRKTDVDAVICVGAYGACAAFIRDARDAGWDVPIANISFVGSDSVHRLLAEHGRATQRDYTRGLVNSQVVPNYDDLSLPAVKEYRAVMDKYRPLPPTELQEQGRALPDYSFGSLEGFLNAKLLVEALNKMGKGVDRARLRTVMESLRDVDLGLSVPVSFSVTKHQGMDRVYYTTIRDGRSVTLDDWRPFAK
jgi:ABC-type branched-subunit amino acid transport system substrate-binding protein